MRTIKKLLLMSMVLLISIGTLFAAGGGQGGGTASSGGTKTIEFWHIQNVDPAPKFIGDAVKRFEAANPEYKVNVIITANDSYKQKIAVAAASGQVPDVFMSWTGGITNEYVKADLLADLTPYFDKNNVKAKFLDGAIEQAKVNGRIYAVPVENTAIAGVWYNKDLFAKYNLTVPKTIAELEAVCDKLKQNGIIPFSLANMTKWTAIMYYQNLPSRHAGIKPFADALAGTGSFNSEPFIWSAKKMQDWVRKGYFNEGFNGLDEDSGQSRTLLYTERAAMQVQGSWFVSNVAGENPDFLKKVGFFNFPADETGTGSPQTVSGTLGDNFYHVSAKSQNPEAAFDMLITLLDDQAVKERIAAGRIPPLKSVTLSDPLMQEVFKTIQAATDVQFWYNESLAPEPREVFETSLQELLGLSISPEEFAKRWQDAQAKSLK
ncbi:MAG: extracellular solute-binding protein [Treponema sp.]|jgi:raffinose/stachyose/melibiose transport system substrate-binding protein|nr:extracellular solute-binding protein [Treponema sp.]